MRAAQGRSAQGRSTQAAWPADGTVRVVCGRASLGYRRASSGRGRVSAGWVRHRSAPRITPPERARPVRPHLRFVPQATNSSIAGRRQGLPAPRTLSSPCCEFDLATMVEPTSQAAIPRTALPVRQADRGNVGADRQVDVTNVVRPCQFASNSPPVFACLTLLCSVFVLDIHYATRYVLSTLSFGGRWRQRGNRQGHRQLTREPVPMQLVQRSDRCDIRRFSPPGPMAAMLSIVGRRQGPSAAEGGP